MEALDRLDVVLLVVFLCLAFFVLAVSGEEGIPEDSAEVAEQKEGRVRQLNDSISNNTLMRMVKDSWEELGVDRVVEEVEEEIKKGNTNYQPLRTRRIKNRGEEFKITREFVKDGEGYVIEGVFYYITRQHYKVGINNRYKDHEIELMTILFDVDVDKNEYGWKISNVELMGSE